MNLSQPSIILASQSPQRRKLLQQVRLAVTSCPVAVDETPMASELPCDLVMRLAMSKARRCLQLQEELSGEGRQTTGRVIIGADTTIDLDNASLGKPLCESDAIEMLLRLAAREHLVHTGVCLIKLSSGMTETCSVTSTVRFGSITAVQAKAYWDSGEPRGKAGGYAIQGLGAQFVAHVSGSYSNIVGLPLYETLQLVAKVA